MIRTVNIRNAGAKGEEIVVEYIEGDIVERRIAYSELDFGVAQAIEDFLATGEVSEYSN